MCHSERSEESRSLVSFSEISIWLMIMGFNNGNRGLNPFRKDNKIALKNKYNVTTNHTNFHKFIKLNIGFLKIRVGSCNSWFPNSFVYFQRFQFSTFVIRG